MKDMRDRILYLYWWAAYDFSWVIAEDESRGVSYYAGFPGETTWEYDQALAQSVEDATNSDYAEFLVYYEFWKTEQDALFDTCAEKHSTLGTYKDGLFSTRDWARAGYMDTSDYGLFGIEQALGYWCAYASTPEGDQAWDAVFRRKGRPV